MPGCMRIGLRHYASETVDWLKATLGSGDCARTSLARKLCEREDWRNAKGEPCLGSARAVLPWLSPALGPPPEARPMGAVSAESLVPSADCPDVRLSCALADIGEVDVVPVADAKRGLALDDGHAPSQGRRRLSRRAHPLLDPVVLPRHPRRLHRRRRLLAPQGARPTPPPTSLIRCEAAGFT